MSAFGTCGLSLGITGDVNDMSKGVLMVLMLIGRVGLISFIIMIGGRREPDKFHYPKERVQIGWLLNVNLNWIVYETMVPVHLTNDVLVLLVSGSKRIVGKYSLLMINVYYYFKLF